MLFIFLRRSYSIVIAMLLVIEASEAMHFMQCDCSLELIL
jgi:hypothetical protein